MNHNSLQRISRIARAALLTALCASGQDHKWAGRTLDGFEWTIHETLAGLPAYSVFDTVRFEVQGKNVALSGQVVDASLKESAELTLRQINGVETVANNIEVLPASRSDAALRMNVYRAIYEKHALEKYGTRTTAPIHIIVKNGWVGLEGVVDSDSDRNSAHRQALKVTAHVSDNLRVAPAE
jgi:osmotically-inducible protein OsmY